MKYSIDDGQTWNDYYISALDSMPLGSIILYAGGSTNVPAGWMICDGTSLSEEEYPALYDIIGHTYGGSGTSFNLPNFKGRVPVGLDSTQTEFNNLSKTGGSKELQAHDHSQVYVDNIEIKWGGTTNTAINMQGINPFTAGDGGSILHTGRTGTGNSGNLQPYIVVNYIIKVEQLTPILGDVLNSHSDSTVDTYCCDYSNEHYGGVVLYENASGSNQTINLSDSASNYSHFIIVYKNTDWNEVFSYTKYDSDSAISITGNHVSSTDRDLYTFKLTMSGTTITWGTSLFSSNNGTPFAYNPFKITKVIGYK